MGAFAVDLLELGAAGSAGSASLATALNLVKARAAAADDDDDGSIFLGFHLHIKQYCKNG